MTDEALITIEIPRRPFQQAVGDQVHSLGIQARNYRPRHFERAAREIVEKVRETIHGLGDSMDVDCIAYGPPDVPLNEKTPIPFTVRFHSVADATKFKLAVGDQIVGALK